MMQYERKYNERSEFRSISSIDLILEYAPLLLDASALDKVGLLLKSRRRIEQQTTEGLSVRLVHARGRLGDAHRLWTLLEEYSAVPRMDLARLLGESKTQLARLVDDWISIGVLRSTPRSDSTSISFSTDLNETFEAKCANCGQVSLAPKIEFLQDAKCVRCNAIANFVLTKAARD
jgi:hypothetical protein